MSNILIGRDDCTSLALKYFSPCIMIGLGFSEGLGFPESLGSPEGFGGDSEGSGNDSEGFDDDSGGFGDRRSEEEELDELRAFSTDSMGL